MILLISTGGKGLRLRPLTEDIPKPMIPVDGKPVLEHLVIWAKDNGIEEIIMLNGYLHKIIEDYFGDGSKFGIKIKHCNETTPLGSGGAVKNAEKIVNSRFVLICGDLACKVRLMPMIKSHMDANSKHDAIATVFLHKSDHPHDSDILKVDSNNKVIKFISKHDDHTDAGDLGNAGLCIFEKRIFDFMPKEKFPLETFLYPKLLGVGEYMNAYISDDYIKDMGTPERLIKVENYLKKFKNE